MTKKKLIYLPVDEEPSELNFDDDYKSIKKVMGSATLTTFRGIWEGRQEIFMCDDQGHAKDLPFNEKATECYHAACVAGTSHPILGDAICLKGELWDQQI